MLATPSLIQEEQWKLFVKAICVLIVCVTTELPNADQSHGVNIAEANTTLACVRLQQTSLHVADKDKQTKQESAPLPEQKTSPEDVTASLTVSVPSKLPGANLLSRNTTCFLKTVIVEICSGPNCCKAQILFDEGAQKVLHDLAACRQLKGRNMQTSENLHICI